MMKKNILLTLGLIFAGMASFAATGDRFQHQGIWYEVIDEINRTCQTAAAQNYELIMAEEWTGGPLSANVKGSDINGNTMWNGMLQGPNYNVGNVSIPTKVTGNGKDYTVVRIGEFGFANGYNQSLSLPETVKEIGTGAFFRSQLQTIDLNQVETIGEYSFYRNNLQNTVTIPSSVKSILANAFAYNQNIRTVVFNEGLEYIGKNAFDNCTSLGGHGNTIVFPNSLREIDDEAFYNCTTLHHFLFGNSLQRVGKNAFWNVAFNEKVPLYLPASLVDIGEGAFNFETNGTNLTDIYYPNPDPDVKPYLVDDHAFGLVDPDESHTWEMDYWIYATVCLHVPYGTIDTYRKLPGWKNFKCIIDDILPEDPESNTGRYDDPLAYILDYIYLVPGDRVNLNEILGENDDVLVWNEIKSGNKDFDVLSLDSKGILEAKSYGNVVALAKRTGITRSEKQGNEWKEVPVKDAVVGAVIVFVCPTITVVYDKEGLTDSEAVTGVAARKPQLRGVSDNEATLLQTSNTTYSHPVVFNSFPKVQVNPTGQIVIQTLERASLDSNNEYLDDKGNQGGELTEVKDKNWDKTGEDGYLGAVVPDHPVTEDRMIVVNLSVPYGISTDNAPIEIDHKISVVSSHRTLRIIGADESADVTVVNLQGQTVYHGHEKVIELDPGVYVITVEDAAFKALVR